MPAPDPNTRAHLEWLGFIQPNGLVVSAPALVKAGVVLNRHDAEGQSRLAGCIRERALDQRRGPEPCIGDFREFATSVLGWGFSSRGYAGTADAPIPPELEVPLPDYGETLRPDFAVRERDPRNGASPWQLLVQVLDAGRDFDVPATGGGTGSRLEASPQGRAERLLRGTGVPAGLLFNGTALRLISAPRGESSGWMDFRVADMSRTAGRPLCSALRLLLSEQRLLALPRHQRLAALLEDSRKYQNEVSERLSEQVMHALYELLRGLQAAHDASGGELLREPLSPEGDRNDIYRGLLSVILRLVFLLYAEERGVLPENETFVRHYSLAGLYQRLREDAALHPDTMDQRFGAWAQLLVLFRLVHDGARGYRTGGAVSLPERRGALFDPDRFPFLEGRRAGAGAGARQRIERVRPPLISDGAVYRVLEKLLVLDGERISYRTLDVEQIGSVYETIMGFRMEIATGRSVAIKPAKKLGAPSTVDLDALLAQGTGNRAKWLQPRTDRNLTDTVAKGLRAAETVEDLHAALDRVLDKDATPDLVPAGALVLQPNEERRRSGSHYTPRELTEPIVRHTLAPILERLRGEDGRAPTPAQILDIKVCDPAMGSGAFLVETCRQLADALIDAWGAHGEMPVIPPDEDEVIHARRLVARKCLYGVDRNPMAVDLAKVSLWLSTLARDHPLTFVDHAFRHGDSLVGLSRRQIEAFHWLRDAQPLQKGIEVGWVHEHMAKATELRRRIREAGEEVSDQELHDLWHDARDEIGAVRLYGDLALAAFFAEAKPKQREAKRLEFAGAVTRNEAIRYQSWLEEQRDADPPLAPFHWEVEFPEVFDRENPGFDAFVGNPPFAGKNAVAAGNVGGYPDWLKTLHDESHGNADLVAHFFRRAFDLVRAGGTFGLIATNTIAQGDTRSSGLRCICEHGGEIYRAVKRYQWPGEAAVVVSVLHVAKTGEVRDGRTGSRDVEAAEVEDRHETGRFPGSRVLDGTRVDAITAFLFHRGGHADPVRLRSNAGKSFQGSIVLGMGFTFDDTDKKGVASPLAEMRRLIEADPRNREVIFPYIGGEEVNTSPTHTHHRYVINFRDWPLRRADRQAQASKTWTPGSVDILSARAGGPPWTTRRRPEIVPAGATPAPPEQPPLLGRAAGSESRFTSPESGREAMRTPANRDRDDKARDERASGDDVPVEMASWAGATDAERREWLRSGVVPVDYPGPVAMDWPDLLGIVMEKVKGTRGSHSTAPWWQFERLRPELYTTIAGLPRVLAISQVTQYVAFAFLPTDMVFAHRLYIFADSRNTLFALLQARVHEVWARFFGSSLEERFMYAAADCFETFPFPDGWETHPPLEAAGRAYYKHRAALMVRNDAGMTKTYNRFHDPYDNDPDIGQLRELHAAMDRAVLDAYGWTDISPDCDFLLDYEIDEATWGRKKKPYRYRWPDPVRDEVLARLLALNAERAADEARLGATTDTSRTTSTPRPAQPQYGRASASRTARSWPQSSNHSDLVPMAETAATMALDAVSRTDQFPRVVKQSSRPVLSDIYPVLWKFAFDRHRIYLRRLAGEVYPWTKDPVLTAYKFTNAFRAADRVSQYLIELVYADPDASEDTLFLRTLLFKTFNKIDTWKRIVGNLGMPVAPEFDYEACGNLLDSCRRDRISIYSGAYIMPSGGRSGATKHRMHLHLIRRMLDDDLPGRLGETKSLAEAYGLLLAYPTLGPFLAFQYAVDLNYTTLMNHSERDFVVAGPGALDGLSKCFESLGDYSPEDTIVWLSDMQMEEFSRYNLDFDGLWGRPLQPIDVQNLLCEVSKYTRATHPDVKGRSGRKRIKQKFRMTGPLPKPHFPPKWGLKQKVAAWLESTRSKDTERAQTLQLTSPAPAPARGSRVPD